MHSGHGMAVAPLTVRGGPRAQLTVVGCAISSPTHTCSADGDVLQSRIKLASHGWAREGTGSGCRRDDELYIHLEGMGAGTLISLARALSESGLRLENHMPMKMKYIHLDSFHFCF